MITGRLHALVFTPRAGRVHVISLRKANRREIRLYEAQDN
ncbi:MAG: BrnT family toxin [Steroidobacteraceae bacterium]|nr:BrnT family toxin [Steroidobacteraceae bacterium]